MNQHTRQNWAEAYDDYMVRGIHAHWIPKILARAQPSAGEHALDVACGTGVVARALAPRLGPQGKVVGVDKSPDMIAVARGLPPVEGAPIEYRVGDAAELPDGPFDIVTCQQGLQFFPDRAAALGEMRRVLRPNGRVVLNVFRELELHPLFDALFRAAARHLDRPIEAVATPYRLHDRGQIISLLEGAGFREVEVIPESCACVFPSAEKFFEMTVTAAAAVIPDLGKDADALARLADAMRRDAGDLLAEHVDGDNVRFTMYAHVAIGWAR